MQKIYLCLILASTLLSCSADDEKVSEVSILVANESLYDFKNVIVNSASGTKDFENIDSQDSSPYQVFESAYRYAFIELQIDGKTYTMQPIDYVGETPLEDGFYTYIINANDSQDQYGKLSLTLRND
ncbi:hypothetical protein [Dokdonia sp. Hel_I_53]|uniref:hypothetical protein n=1 Tax=Dokdonia sp. Hel_I_53 TaxID=1566287 RepID=UPI00119A0367|nr:hypothetical protein [Dokdonia sp. Hel_I_53]TVZ51690.1 hypothetical protein OD90_0841 [Dokdonia sp. Hel_I_53]